jgi:phenylacetate-CoA ligase
LQKLPVVTKAMLRPAYPDQTTRNTGQPDFEVCSSGSTGNPFRVREDADTAGQYRAVFLLMLEWSGWRIGLPHVQTGITPDRSGPKQIKDLLLRCRYIPAFDLTDPHLDTVLDFMDSHHIRFLWGYPGSLYSLARRAAHRGWNQPLKSVAAWGDNLYAHYRRTIEQVFKTKVYNQYGCGEGVEISAQCAHGDWLHVFDTDVIVEYLDEQASPVPPGRTGNIVVTRLHPGPMPLIRYQVGDVGASGGDRRCECGRGLSVMESIQGRDTDIVFTPGGNRLIVHFFTGILEFFPQVDLFQVVQQDVHSIDLRIVPHPDFTDALKQRIINRLKQAGADLDIRIQLVDAIPTTANGKRRFVINKMQNPNTDLPQEPSLDI